LTLGQRFIAGNRQVNRASQRDACTLLALQASRWDAVSVSFAPDNEWPGY
jgi:hypothetical protein